MKKLFFSVILSFFMMPAAHAGKFEGSFKFLDADGNELYVGALKLERKFDKDGNLVHIYKEPLADKVTITKCSVTIKNQKNQPRQVSESCPQWGTTHLECVGANCLGTISLDYIEGATASVTEKNNSKERIQVITLDKPTSYLGMKVKKYIQVLKKPE